MTRITSNFRMLGFLNDRLREGARRFELYNDGDVVYLYDFGSADQLRQSQAVKVILGDIEAREKRLKEIEKQSLIVVYELMQDDSRDIELAIGPPLNSKEKKVGKWHRAQRTLLNIPSGKLRIESPNSLTIGEDDPTDEGVTLDVPPGDYVLTLERVNWEEMEVDEETILPTEFLSLCPISEAKPQKPKAFLSWAGVVGDRAKWESDWKVSDDEFRGRMKATWDGNLAMNFTPAAAAKLGARVGEILHAEGDGVSADFLYLGVRTPYGMERALGREVVGELVRRETLVSIPQYAETPRATLICFEGPASKSLPKHQNPMPVTVTKTGTHALEPTDNSFAKVIVVTKEAVMGHVLACSKKYLNINVLPVHLLKLGYKWGQPIRLTIGKETRNVFIDNQMSKDAIAKAKFEAATQPLVVGLNARVMTHWEVRGLEIWDLEPLVGEEHFLEAKAGDRVEIRV